MAEQKSKFYLRTKFLIERGITPEFLSKKINIDKKYIRRFYSRTRTPTMEALLVMAKEANTNISYLLSFTENDAPNDTYEINLRVKEMKEEMGLSTAQLADISGVAPKTIVSYETKKSNGEWVGIVTLANLAQSMNVTVDYLAGLTDREKWDPNDPFPAGVSKTALMHSEFLFFLNSIDGGSAIYIKTQSYEGFCLLSYNKKNIIMPDGEQYPITHLIFKDISYSLATRGY